MRDAGAPQPLPLRRPVAAAARAARGDDRDLESGGPLRLGQTDQRAAGAAPQERRHVDDAARPPPRGVPVRHGRIVACGKRFPAGCGIVPGMPWSQIYDPFGALGVSTLIAAIPVVVLLGTLALLKWHAHNAALAGLAAALVVAIGAFHMPVPMALATAGYGAAYGLFPIGWIVINVIFLYQLTNDRGLFTVLRESITHVTDDRRLQLLLVAFCFGAFFEGAAGFGTPVAVTGAILMGLGFSPLAASGLSLIANTAPVAFGALGTPIIALQSVTDLDLLKLSAMVGRQLPLFSVIVPFWLVWAFAGFRGMLGVWPAILVAGLAFAVPQFLVSNFHGPWLVDVVAAVASMAALAAFLKVWKPASVWRLDSDAGDTSAPAKPAAGLVLRAWTALDHPQRAGLRLGAAADQGVARRPDHGARPGARPAQPGRARAAGGRDRQDGAGAVYVAELAVGDRHRHLRRGDHRRAGHGLLDRRDGAHLPAHAAAGEVLAGDDRGDDGRRLHDPLLGPRRDARPRLRADRRALPVLRRRCSAGWASRSPDRTRRRTCSSDHCRRSPPSSSA